MVGRNTIVIVSFNTNLSNDTMPPSNDTMPYKLSTISVDLTPLNGTGVLILNFSTVMLNQLCWRATLLKHMKMK